MSSERYTRNSILKRTNEIEENIQKVARHLDVINSWVLQTEHRINITNQNLRWITHILFYLAVILCVAFGCYFIIIARYFYPEVFEGVFSTLQDIPHQIQLFYVNFI